MDALLHEFNNAGKIAQIEFSEVTMDSAQQEKLAIETYIHGLKPKIKRYICQQGVYHDLHLHLDELKRRSIVPLPRLYN